MATDDRALFNRFALSIFAKLQEAFPTEVSLRPHDILREEGMEPTAHSLAICDRTLSWLCQEGYFSSPGTVIGEVGPKELQTIYSRARLTTRGYAALDAPIEFSGTKGKAGEFIAKQAKEAAGEARGAIIGDLIGRVIGEAAKAFFKP
jgi:hypothetical protein